MPRSILLAASLLLLTGCGPGWHRTDPAPGTALSQRDQFLIHHGDSADRWHAVQISDDSVAGIPWLKPINCDSCRVALPRARVDSIRAGHPVRGLWKGYALAVFGPPAILTAICVLSGEGAACWVPVD
jgi:hypothetical protein